MKHLFYIIFLSFWCIPLVIRAASLDSPTPSETPQIDDIAPSVSSYNKTLKNRYSFFVHKRNFLLPITYNAQTHPELYSELAGQGPADKPYYQSTEAEFQLSFFAPLVRDVFFEDTDFLVAYTHHSWWQFYNSAWSKPFRETNYTPELFLRKALGETKIFGNSEEVSAVDFGYIHESNGQFQALSRSWDRIFARLNFSQKNFSMVLTTWFRIPEKREKDDNRDIYKYYGYGEAAFHYALGEHTVDFKVPISEKPGIDLGYSFPVKNFFRLYANYRWGYAHSLIEYNKSIQRFGIGITLESASDHR